MKKAIIPILLILMVVLSCGQLKTDSKESKAAKATVDLIEQNKKIAVKYHDLNADDIDEIFAEGFIGHGEYHDWDLESHRDYLSSERYMVDSISCQIAEGDWVATMFTRTMDYQGERITLPIMHFKRIEDGRIAEVWEYYDYSEESEESVESEE